MKATNRVIPKILLLSLLLLLVSACEEKGGAGGGGGGDQARRNETPEEARARRERERLAASAVTGKTPLTTKASIDGLETGHSSVVKALESLQVDARRPSDVGLTLPTTVIDRRALFDRNPRREDVPMNAKAPEPPNKAPPYTKAPEPLAKAQAEPPRFSDSGYLGSHRGAAAQIISDL